jgi:beta-xylosidase
MLRVYAPALAILLIAAGCKSDNDDPQPTDWPSGPAATYDNPVLPGDHPDLNIFVDGDDFYLAGSNFAMFPALEILHSTDLIHWERVSRVVDADAEALDELTDPGEGTWGAFITRAPNGYRVYFAINATQWFAEAASLAGPWTEPVQVTPFPISPDGGITFFDRGTGSDNSVFVDPDTQKTYMVTKNGIGPWLNPTDNFFGMNRLVEIDFATGQLVEASMINLDFVNWDPEKGGDGPVRDYSSWAEGPTMTKRGDWYYYFVQTHTACDGNTNVWASRTLDSDPANWHWLGFPAAQIAPYRGAQHPTAPFQIADGTWWVVEHSYDCTNKTDAVNNGEWLGLAREGLLHQVTWVDTEIDGLTIPVPYIEKNTRNLPAPRLAQSGTPFLIPVNDDFAGEKLGTPWTTYDRMGDRLSVEGGFLTIAPGADATAWALQKDALRATASLVKVEFVPQAEGNAAGICVRNGYWNDEQLLSGPTWIEGEGLIVGTHDVQVARTMVDGQDVIRFAYRMRRPNPNAGGSESNYQNLGLADPVVVSYTVPTPAPAEAAVWLKLVRNDHQATGWVSADRLTWTQVGRAIDISALDNHYGMAHSWVGSQAGMFATNQSARFDLFTYRDGFTTIPAVATDQQFGTAVVASDARGSVLGELQSGDWAMYGGVDLGSGGVASAAALIEASSIRGGSVEIWVDPLAGGPRYTCRVDATGSWESFATTTCPIEATTGTHDVYVKVVGGRGRELVMRIASLRFTP